MDQTLLQKIFIFCGKKSAWPLVSKFFHDFSRTDQCAELLLENEFPDYQARIAPLVLKKKHDNAKFIYTLISSHIELSRNNSCYDHISSSYDHCRNSKPRVSITSHSTHQQLLSKLNYFKSSIFPIQILLRPSDIKYFQSQSNPCLSPSSEELSFPQVKQILLLRRIPRFSFADHFKHLKKITAEFLKNFDHDTLEVLILRNFGDSIPMFRLPNLRKLVIKAFASAVYSDVFPLSTNLRFVQPSRLIFKKKLQHLEKIVFNQQFYIPWFWANSSFCGTSPKSLELACDEIFQEKFDPECFDKIGLSLERLQSLTFICPGTDSSVKNFFDIPLSNFIASLNLNQLNICLTEIIQSARPSNLSLSLFLGLAPKVSIVVARTTKLLFPNTLSNFTSLKKLDLWCGGVQTRQFRISLFQSISTAQLQSFTTNLFCEESSKFLTSQSIQRLYVCNYVSLRCATYLLDFGNVYRLDLEIGDYIIPDQELMMLCMNLLKNRVRHLKIKVKNHMTHIPSLNMLFAFFNKHALKFRKCTLLLTGGIGGGRFQSFSCYHTDGNEAPLIENFLDKGTSIPY